MKKIGDSYKGKNYDIYFNWNDDELYCSELIWKIYEQGAGLKIGELKPADVAQMMLYVNMYDDKIKMETENPTIGIILCKSKKESEFFS